MNNKTKTVTLAIALTVLCFYLTIDSAIELDLSRTHHLNNELAVGGMLVIYFVIGLCSACFASFQLMAGEE